ncbi:MAG: tetratricopeptide repeat protein [Desulfurivibrionaceae bacterium]|nr:tetratricopeptide repeat protein [Desulfobulbales bacterium]MDT8335772.1 tetratricopeptide repeat protein [Desulfurivibrionaceae bacterium]
MDRSQKKPYGFVGVQILLLAIFTAIIYANTIDNQFVFDDSRIYLSPHVRLTSLDFQSVAAAWRNIEPRTRPLANLSFALNYYFHQDEVRGYRLVNIAIHAVAGIFLFLLLRTTLNLPGLRTRYAAYGWLPFVGALLWLAHPVQTQSVSYTIQRMNSLAAMFFVIALFAYARGRLAAGWPARVALFGCAAGAGLFSLWSKEIALTLPFFMVLYDWYFLRDLAVGRLRKYGLWAGGALGLLGLAAIFFYFGQAPLDALLAGYAGRDFTMGERLLTEARVVVFYLSLLVLPLPGRLNLDHHFLVSRSWLDPTNTALALLGLALLAILAVRLARRQRLLSFGIIWFLGNLAIESTVVPLELVFEHRLYLPSMLLLAALAAFVRERLPDNHAPPAVALVLVLLLSFWTCQRNQVWAGPLTLWRDCAAKSPDKARVHGNFGVALKRAGRLEEAETHFRTTVALDPAFFEAYNNLGNLMAMRGRPREAEPFYRRALAIKPDNPVLHVNLGNALMDMWRLEEARDHYRRAMLLHPGDREARANFFRVERLIKGSGTK